MKIAFIPVGRTNIPALFVRQVNNRLTGAYGEHFFECIDINGDVQIKTVHANAADALRQVALRMDVDKHYDYGVEKE